MFPEFLFQGTVLSILGAVRTIIGLDEKRVNNGRLCQKNYEGFSIYIYVLKQRSYTAFERTRLSSIIGVFLFWIDKLELSELTPY